MINSNVELSLRHILLFLVLLYGLGLLRLMKWAHGQIMKKFTKEACLSIIILFFLCFNMNFFSILVLGSSFRPCISQEL